MRKEGAMRRKTRVGVHWLRFTGDSELLGDVIAFLEATLEIRSWRQERGRWGYAWRWTAGGGLDVLFGGQGGFCVDISGAWLEALNDEKILQLISFASLFKVVRIDIYADCFDGGDLVRKVVEKVRSGEYVSTASNIAVFETLKGREVGTTVCIGSRVSSKFFRVYNKRRLSRVEVELKDELASAAAAAIASGESLGCVLRGVISFRFLEKISDKNKSRWPVALWWNEFVQQLGDAVRIVVCRTRDALKLSLAYCEAAIRCVAFLKIHGLYSRLVDRALAKFDESVWGLRHLFMRNFAAQEA